MRTDQRSEMPCLSKFRYKIWTAAKEFERDFRRPGTIEEIAAVLGVYPLQVSRQIGEMLSFVVASDDRTIRAIEPLHVRFIAQVCADLRVSQREFLSEKTGTQLNRARIIVAKRLRVAGYTVVDICRVLDRCDTTVQLYWNPNLRQRRSVARRKLYRAKRDSQQQKAA